MKNRFLAAAVILFPLAVFFFFWENSGVVKMPSPGTNQISQAVALSNALANQNPQTVALIASNFARVQPVPENRDAGAVAGAPAGPSLQLQFTNFAPATVGENIRHAIRQFGQMFGGNPVGNNQEITSQLNGNNPRHINFINADAGMRINGNGELVDPWGTPYFFHQISGTDTEIHSAGPDKVMWTLDDVVTH